MRVISGALRGRKLREPAGEEIRPTSDMVKESIFNIIQFDIEGRSVLDMFSGTGQLGIEALSRGAGHVEFVDNSRKAVILIRENLEKCGLSGAASVNCRDALWYLEYCGTFDLIFMDPPYGTELTKKALDYIIKFDKLNVNGIIICEMSAESAAPSASYPYVFCKEYTYGSVKICKYERQV